MTSPSERFVTLATAVVLVVALAQGGWTAYRALNVAHVATTYTLPAGVRDLRHQSLPPLRVAAVSGTSLAAELSRPRVLIAFLRTTCPACQAAEPALLDLQRHRPPDTGLVAVFMEAPGVIRAALHNTLPAFTDVTGEAWSAFGVKSIPAFFVVRDAQVSAQFVGWSEDAWRGLKAALN